MLQPAKKSWFSVSASALCAVRPTAHVPQRVWPDVRRICGHKIFLRLVHTVRHLSEIKGARMVKNVIFDLGGVVLEWNPDRILAGCYADPEMRALMKTALFLHPDWLQLDRGTLSEADLVARAAGRTG